MRTMSELLHEFLSNPDDEGVKEEIVRRKDELYKYIDEHGNEKADLDQYPQEALYKFLELVDS